MAAAQVAGTRACRPPSRSPQAGFTVPVGRVDRAEGARLGPLVARAPGVAEIADAAAVEALFRAEGKRAGFAAWTLLFWALWHRRHALGLRPDGDVFHCLASS